MINRNTKIGKMLSKERVVYQCVVCNCKFIGSYNTDITTCPSCKREGTIVVNETLSVRMTPDYINK